MWSTTVPLNPKVQKLWSYFYTSCDFAHVGGEHYFGQKSTYNIYPNKSPPTLLIFSPIGSLMPNFRQFWRADFEISEKNTTFWVWGPHTTHAGKRVPPRPATTKDSTRYARNHGRGHPVEVIRARLEGRGKPKQMEEGRLILKFEILCFTSCYLF